MNTVEPSTLLIVDDLPANLNVLRDLLEPAGYQILGATSGEMALQILARALPHLILLDVTMPGMDGFETCRELKRNSATAHLPVIFITARSEPESVLKGFQAGGVDYILKPFNQEEVLARVRTHAQIALLNQALCRRNLELERLTAELQTRQQELEAALASIKTLKGLIPICAHCKKIRDDRGYWQQVESYVMKHSDATFSHGICPACAKTYWGQTL